MAGATGAREALPTPFEQVFRRVPSALLVIRAEGLVMLDANRPYLDQVRLELSDLVGRNVFEVFPESPENGDSQVGVLRRLMTDAIRDKATCQAWALRYDIPVGDGFEVRWWNAQEIPILDADGEVEYLLHFSEDITEMVRTRDELAHAQQARERATLVATTQADLALALVGARTMADLLDLVLTTLRTTVGCAAAGLVTRAADGGWQATMAADVDPGVRATYGHLAFEHALPAVTSARRGVRVLIPDLTTGVAMSPAVAQLHADTGCQAWACFPLGVDTRRVGSLSVAWLEPHLVDDDELDLLESIAAQCALGVVRLESAAAQQEAADQLQVLAESLQNAMLIRPPQLEHLEIAVRYRSAADVAKVGGDWYDAFVQPDGAVMVTIGDVVGHDHIAAGKMGQLSGLLRALAFDDPHDPHGIDPVATLRRYEHVAAALGLDELATVVLARIEPDHDGHWVRWSNAGSPPPVLVEPDGTARLLDDKPDLMLGVDAAAERGEHVVHLGPGATLLLYTDGLIERRNASIDDGMRELAAAVSQAADLPLEELCDQVLEQLSPHIGEDDVAMVAVRPRR